MARALIGLGSNLGDRQQSLEAAVAQLAHLEQSRLLARSTWHETLPVGGPPDQQPFLNGAVTLETSQSPLALLAHLQRIERDLKRERHAAWGARTLDLDLLLYDNLALETPTLTIPHPRMAFRRFVLAPAKEIAADWPHPATGWTVAQLLAHLDTAAPYVAIAGVTADAREQLAAGVLSRLPSMLIHLPEEFPAADESGDPTGRTFRLAIELLDRQAELLQGTASSALVVSDFWFGQLLAEAAIALDPAVLAAFETQWRQRNAQVVQPKLLVWLGDSAADLSGVESSTRSGRARQLAEQLSHPGWGPVLKVTPTCAISPLDETVAAIQAMA